MKPNICLFWCVKLKLKSSLLAFSALGLLGMGQEIPKVGIGEMPACHWLLGSGDMTITC